jgi:hypothetical protein
MCSLKLKIYFFEACELRFFKVDLVSDARCHERVFATGVPKYNNTHLVEENNVHHLPTNLRGWGVGNKH